MALRWCAADKVLSWCGSGLVTLCCYVDGEISRSGKEKGGESHLCGFQIVKLRSVWECPRSVRLSRTQDSTASGPGHSFCRVGSRAK